MDARHLTCAGCTNRDDYAPVPHTYAAGCRHVGPDVSSAKWNQSQRVDIGRQLAAQFDQKMQQQFNQPRVTTEAKARKATPLCTGCLDYFPDALLAVAELSRIGNDQHNPGQPMHWAKDKSTDEPDALLRHLVDRGTLDTDGVRHSAKVAWRALALLQREIEMEKGTQHGETA